MLRVIKLVLFFLLVYTIPFGCEKSLPPLDCHPVQGTIFDHNNKPITRGGLIFIPESGTWGINTINANIEKDGTFSVNTSRYNKSQTEMVPGAPVGRYKVIYHPPGDGQVLDLEQEMTEIVEIEAKTNTLKFIVPPLPEKQPGQGKPRDPNEPDDE